MGEKGRKGRKIGKKDEKDEKGVISVFRSSVRSHATHAIGELKNRQEKWYDLCLFGRAEILVIFGWHFGTKDDLLN